MLLLDNKSKEILNPLQNRLRKSETRLISVNIYWVLSGKLTKR